MIDPYHAARLTYYSVRLCLVPSGTKFKRDCPDDLDKTMCVPATVRTIPYKVDYLYIYM